MDRFDTEIVGLLFEAFDMFRGQAVHVLASFAIEHIDVEWCSQALFRLQTK